MTEIVSQAEVEKRVGWVGGRGGGCRHTLHRSRRQGSGAMAQVRLGLGEEGMGNLEGRVGHGCREGTAALAA